MYMTRNKKNFERWKKI